jgi:UDP:flavonoid glycosyltransferase YjiC (YdhE family)
MESPLGAAGFEAITAGPAIPAPDTIVPLAPIDSERELRVIRKRFVSGLPGQRAAATRTVFEAWRPDLVVAEETDCGVLVAAECLDLPHATVAVIAAGSFLTIEVLREPLNALRAEHGLAFDPELEMLTRDVYVVPGPAAFRDPAFPLPATAISMQPAALESAPAAEASERRTVYFTLGTIFNKESGDLFARVLSGLSGLPADVVATVGADLDPGSFGAQPANVRVERYIPQSEVLARSAAVVSHAGSGTMLGAIAFGLPSVLIPMGADQPFNAARADALGIARVLDALTCSPEEVRDAVSAVLTDPSYRDRAQALGAAARALPSAADVWPRLEQLVK